MGNSDILTVGRARAKQEGITPCAYFNVPWKTITRDKLIRKIIEERFKSERNLHEAENKLLEEMFERKEKEYQVWTFFHPSHKARI